jgi:hypothetical protein
MGRASRALRIVAEKVVLEALFPLFSDAPERQ